MSEVFALFAGGGTGGHTYPAIAVAQELVRRGHPPATVRFVGGRRGIEGRVVTEAGFAIDLLAGRGLQRRLTPANIAAIWGAFTAFLAALRLVRRYRPRVVVGFGGYASLPCVVAARVLRVPTIVHDQDAVPGLANRIGVRLGARTAVSLPGDDAAERDADRKPGPVVDRGHRAGTGAGSRAARGLRRRAGRPYDQPRRDRLLRPLARPLDMTVRHVCGPRNEVECAAALDAQRREGDALAYELVPYEPHMEALLAARRWPSAAPVPGPSPSSPWPVCPAVLVPLPGSPGDHQVRNARTLEQAGAAVVVLDEDCDPPRLDAVVSELLAEPDRLDRMSAAARSSAGPTPRRGSRISSRSTPVPHRVTTRSTSRVRASCTSWAWVASA